jgi:hypothetical protein
MKTYSSFRISNFINTFTIFFFVFTFLWAIGNYIIIRDVLISWPVFIVNFSLGIGFGFWFYRRRYHLNFSYDKHGFDLRIGEKQIKRQWNEFGLVSLYHQGNEEFSVRVYESEDEFIDIPVSALKIQPNEFRREVMAFIKEPG